jgi:hypothetical protein
MTVYLNGDRTVGLREGGPTVLESFGDGLTPYTGDSGYSIVGTAYDGDGQAVEGSSSLGMVYRDDGNGLTPRGTDTTPETYNYRQYVPSGITMDAGVMFNVQRDSTGAGDVYGYWAGNFYNGTNDEMFFYRYDGGSRTRFAYKELSGKVVPRDSYGAIRIDLGGSDITAEWLDGGDPGSANRITTLTGTDSTYTGGALGFLCYNPHIFDYVTAP